MKEQMSTADRAAGFALIAAAAGTVLAMAHHPTGAHGGAIGGIVHGAMIALLALGTFGFAHISRRRGLGRPAVLAGLAAYGVALFGHAGAATINGFIVPALAARGEAVGHDLYLFAWAANQALARLGVFAAGAAFILWGVDLLRSRPWLGGAGIVAGAAPSAALLAGALEMNVAGAFIVYASHAAWTALLGVYLIRGGVSESG